ncbi:MAG: ion transporter [Verrucomicrobiales bacterium]
MSLPEKMAPRIMVAMPEVDGIREKWRKIIFEAETPAGRLFDVVVLWMIGVSVMVVMLESVDSINQHMGSTFYILEWVFTVFFTIEYVGRLATSERPSAYARSFFGVVDLLSILPSYVGLIVPGGQALMVVRVLRLLRVFRVLKMARHIEGSAILMRALFQSRAKITVFFVTLLSITLIAGSLMYLVEGKENGYTSIPVSVYWAVVTVTTLGYGDLSPVTPVGKLLTSLLVLTGYAILAVPTGIVTAEIARADGSSSSAACPSCGVHGHLPDAKYCRRCSAELHR